MLEEDIQNITIKLEWTATKNNLIELLLLHPAILNCRVQQQQFIEAKVNFFCLFVNSLYLCVIELQGKGNKSNEIRIHY
ncbi:MAG: hypothetical protein Q4C98_09150 [Capnocytophaga sp.]|nr:hypothetical protein [Capnocytophaga sp.]